MTAKAQSLLAQAQKTLLTPYGLDVADLTKVFSTIMDNDVDYADLYFQYSRSEAWSLEEGIVKSGSFNIDEGVGVRAISGEKTAFAYSDDISRVALGDAAAAVRAIASAGQQRRVPAFEKRSGHALYVPVDPLGSLPAADKVKLLERLEAYARAEDSRVREVMAHVLGTAADGGASAAAKPRIDAVSLKAKELRWLGRRLDEVEANARATPTQWSVRLDSRQAAGELVWDGAGEGRLNARLRKLTLEPVSDSARSAQATHEAVDKLPALDVVIDDFAIGARRFGRVEMQARNNAGIWQLSRVEVGYPYGKLTGSGVWQLSSGRNRTQLDFVVDSSDVGKLLDRLGYPETVRAGTAQLAGSLGWNGAPTDLDFATLSGEMKLDARRGQFIKLDPGAAGKLLALISLQGLPRRISLDFKDVFSDGLAFDSITSKLAVKNGVMSTDRLQIDGPSARVVMHGEVDLKRETQHLAVNVQPDLSSTAAIGVGLVNPLAGVATLLAQKVLQGPLNQIFGFDYLITGTWDDPKVEKLGAAAPSLPERKTPTGTSNEPADK